MDLQGKRALITGGTKGIGAAIAIDLAKAGVDVAVNGRHQDEEADQVVAAIEKHGRRAVMLTGDMADGADAERVVQEAAEKLGGLDILVHSAGGPSFGTIDQIDFQQWRDTFAVHVDAAFHLCRTALPLLRKNDEGAILFISSAAGIRGCPGAIAYGTVKGAISHFTRMLARDVADDNIRVNCLNPGVIRTRFHDKMTDAQRKHNLENRIPLHREGTCEQVAEAGRLLIANDYITGEAITVDGGLTMQVTR